MSTECLLSLPDFKLDTGKVWGLLFGEDIQSVRESKGLSVKETAGRAGMTVTEWKAIEAGQVPQSWAQICSMARGLRERKVKMASLVLLYGGAWDKDQDLPGEIMCRYS